MNKSKSQITSHIHIRIAKLAQQALDSGSIVQCDRTEKNTYLLRKPNELTPTEYNPIATGSILVALLTQ